MVQQRGSRVASKSEKCIHSNMQVHIQTTYNTQGILPDRGFERKMDNIVGEAKARIDGIDRNKGAYLNPSLPPLSSFLLLAMRCHLLSLRSGTLLALTKEDVSLRNTRMCPLTEGATVLKERGGGRGERVGERGEGQGRILIISPFWMKSDLHVSFFSFWFSLFPQSLSVNFERHASGVMHWMSPSLSFFRHKMKS